MGVMDKENRIEYLDHKGYCSMGKIFQDPICDTVWPGALLAMTSPMASWTSSVCGLIGFSGSGQDVTSQRHVNHLNNCQDRRIGYRLKRRLQNVGKGLCFFKI
jgi:hypothetical protein